MVPQTQGVGRGTFHARRPRQGSGFTLIELLVVVTIISLLVAILLPSLSTAREAAHSTVSLSNIRQITIALNIYTGDFNNSMPFQNVWSSNAGGYFPNRWSRQWSRVLHEDGYLASSDTYWSPARHVYPGEWPRSRSTTHQMQHTYESVGYGLNTGVASAHESDFLNGTSDGVWTLGVSHLNPMRLGTGNVPPPDRMLLLAESYNVGNAFGGLNGIYLINPGRWDSGSATRIYSYRRGAVRSYIDGHAFAAVFSGASTSVRIVGAEAHAYSSNRMPPHPGEIGWDANRPPFSGAAYGGPYDGHWTYVNVADHDRHTPWYRYWRTQWYPGLR